MKHCTETQPCVSVKDRNARDSNAIYGFSELCVQTRFAAFIAHFAKFFSSKNDAEDREAYHQLELYKFGFQSSEKKVWKHDGSLGVTRSNPGRPFSLGDIAGQYGIPQYAIG